MVTVKLVQEIFDVGDGSIGTPENHHRPALRSYFNVERTTTCLKRQPDDHEEHVPSIGD
jgi:hypothetical protein